MARLFRRDRSAQPPRTGPGSVTGRQASGLHILSDVDDWVPEDVAAQAPAPARPDTPSSPSDWLPPDLPEPTSAPPPPSRKRSTITEVPPEMLAAPPPAPVDLRRTVEEMQAALAEARGETDRLRRELDALRREPAPGVNVNTATVDELMVLPGMTRRGAQALVEHREANGSFASLDGLLEVPGFHADRVERLAGRATV